MLEFHADDLPIHRKLWTVIEYCRIFCPFSQSSETTTATASSSSSSSSSQLQNHMNGSSGCDIVRFQCLVIGQLFSRMDQPNLIDLDALLFLKCLFDGQYLILWLKIEGLFAPCQGLDKNLYLSIHTETERQGGQTKKKGGECECGYQLKLKRRPD